MTRRYVLRVGSPQSRLLTADPGALVMAPSSAQLRALRRLPADPSALQLQTVDATLTYNSQQIPAGFVYPGSPTEEFNPDPDETTMLVLNQSASGATVPPLSDGLMAIWWSIPFASQGGYWSGFFHSAYSFSTWGGGGGTDPSAMRYVGSHPYLGDLWEISANVADESYNDQGVLAEITEWNRKYVHVLLCTPNGSGGVDYRFHYDYGENPARYIEVLNDTKTDPSAALRGVIQGDAPWNRGNERYNGVVSQPDIYSGKTFTTADADVAIADEFDAALASYLRFTNRYPTSNLDISNKTPGGGIGDPVWVIGANQTIPALYQEAA